MGFLNDVGDSIQRELNKNGINGVDDVTKMAVENGGSWVGYKIKQHQQTQDFQNGKERNLSYGDAMEQASKSVEPGLFSFEVNDEYTVALTKGGVEKLRNSASFQPNVDSTSNRQELLVQHVKDNVKTSLVTNGKDSIGGMVQLDLSSMVKDGTTKLEVNAIGTHDKQETKVMIGGRLSF